MMGKMIKSENEGIRFGCLFLWSERSESEFGSQIVSLSDLLVNVFVSAASFISAFLAASRFLVGSVSIAFTSTFAAASTSSTTAATAATAAFFLLSAPAAATSVAIAAIHTAIRSLATATPEDKC